MAQATAPSTGKTRRIFRSSPHQQDQQPKKSESILKSPGSLLVAAFGCLFVGYIFNTRGLKTFLDNYFGALNHSAQSHQGVVSSLFIKGLPLVGAGIVVFIAIAVLRALGPSSRTLGHTKAQETRGVESFATAAGEHGVSLKVSRAAYRMLLPHVRKGKQLGVGDTLCQDLKVKPDFVSELYGSLLRHADRRRRQGDDGSSIHTVLGLLMAVEASEDKSIPTATVLAFQAAAPVAAGVAKAAKVVAIAHSGPPEVPKAAPMEKPKQEAAVFVRPARLARRELSMIRTRSARGF